MRTPSEAIAELLAHPPMGGIIEAARRHPAPVFAVGGAVRDALLGRAPADLDIALGGDLEAFVEVFAQCCGRRPVAIGDAWRDTRRTNCDGLQVDVARLLGDLGQDLSQRDFTVNAMAVPLNEDAEAAVAGFGTAAAEGRLIDEHGGLADVEAGVLRMLSTSVLDEDPLRLLRAARYVATLPGFAVEEATDAAIAERAGLIGEVAAERVQTEWKLLLGGDAWAEGVRLAASQGLTPTVVSSVDSGAVEAWRSFEAVPAADGTDDLAVVRLAVLIGSDASARPSETVDELVDRRWPVTLARSAVRTAEWAARVDDAEVADLVEWAVADRRAARRAGRLAAAFAAHEGRAAPSNSALLDDFARRAAEAPWVNGDDLMSWGMKEGPELGELLGRVSRGQIERRWDSPEPARSWAREQVAREIGALPPAVDG